MRMMKAIVAAVSISMASAPVLAQNASAPLSLARAGASTQDASSLDGSDQLLPGLVIIAILAAAILWTSNKDSDLSNPVSP